MSKNQEFLDGHGIKTNDLDIRADVLVLGGGPAGTWAAWSAAKERARVVLVDKGYCGTSGATASGGTVIWYVPPEPEKREVAIASRESLGGFLADRYWMNRVLEQTYINVNQLADWGYPFPVNEQGESYRLSLQGPEYMRLMRKKVQRVGVRILDHSPALELLVDSNGVGGAAGIQRQLGGRWIVRSKAVIIATGGCAFLSNALGCNVLTGDGYLMAAEAGAQMSGMEFSNNYAISATFSSVTKAFPYNWATFTFKDGSIIEGASSPWGRSIIDYTLLSQQVYACLDKASEEIRAALRAAQPNFFLPFDRVGIDPFTQRFPITLRLEGTVRGTGGIRILDDTCATSVPGLFAAGDAATRELICGAFTGGGSHNAAWAMSSGFWAGKAAATYARRLGNTATHRQLRGIGEVALHPTGSILSSLSLEDLIQAVQAEVFPYDRNLFRTEKGLSESLSRLYSLWKDVRAGLVATEYNNLVRFREVAAMIATARWMYASAIERKETRGMHRHQDYPELDLDQQHHLVSGGLDQVWVRPQKKLTN